MGCDLKTIRRVTVYTDESLEQPLVQQFLKMGAPGYTVVECRSGKGTHGLMEDPMMGRHSRIRIVLLVEPEVGEKILDYLCGAQFSRRAVLACVETVQVSAREHY